MQVKYSIIYFLLFLLGLLPRYHSQLKKSDSILRLTANFKNTISHKDTNTIKSLNGFSMSARKKSKLDTALILAQRALDMSTLLSASSNSAVQHAAKLAMASAYNNIGSAYDEFGNNSEAMVNYDKALRIREEIGDVYGTAASLNNIAMKYYEIGNREAALKFYYKALEINKKNHFVSFMSKNYNNIGNYYLEENNLDKALEFYTISLGYKREVNDQAGISMSYNNIGSVYEKKGNYKTADSLYRLGLDIDRKTNNKKSLIHTLYNVANLLKEAGKIKEAGSLINEAIEIAKSRNSIDRLTELYYLRAKIDSLAGNYKNAYINRGLHFHYKELIKNESAGKKAIQMQMQYEFDKKEGAQKAEQEKLNALAKKELEAEKTQRNYLLIVLLAMLLLIVFVYRGYRDKKAGNKILAVKNEIIQEKQEEILASIHYAKRIQKAHLPSEKYLSRTLGRLMKN